MDAEKGFSLVELMVTIALIGIVITFAIPGYKTFVQNDRLITQINNLTGHLAYARSEAVKRKQQVVLCVSSNNDTLTPSCTGGNNWEQGWLVFVDVDNDEVMTEADELLRVRQSLDANNTLTGNDTSITYDYRGFLKASVASSFALCDERYEEYGKAITVSLTGRVRKESGVTSC